MARILPATGLAAILSLAGCATPQNGAAWRDCLEETVPAPAKIRSRSDLLELSDCRLVFDLSAIPPEVGLQVVDYDPFGVDARKPPKPVRCPVRHVFERVLEEGTAPVFVGGDSVGETRVALVPRYIGLAKAAGGITASITVSCTIEGVQAGVWSSDKTAPWTDRERVPVALYQAVSDIGDQLMASIAGSRQLRDVMLASRKGAGTMPKIADADIGGVKNGAFTGRVTVDQGSWDPARARQWVRSQLGQIAAAKLGVKSLDNYRVVLENETADADDASRFVVDFRVFPYQGYDIDYDSRTRRGKCSADLAFLGCSPEEAYAKARSFLATMLADQGVVLHGNEKGTAAEFRFDGFGLSDDGAQIEMPFELVN